MESDANNAARVDMQSEDPMNAARDMAEVLDSVAAQQEDSFLS